MKVLHIRARSFHGKFELLDGLAYMGGPLESYPPRIPLAPFTVGSWIVQPKQEALTGFGLLGGCLPQS